MSDISKKIRERSVNFTSVEITKLLKLIEKYKTIIESKKTDSVSWREKEQCWNNLENEFNSSSGQYLRNKKNLKTKYESLKKDLKRKISKNKVELFKTGGGPKDIIILTSDEELLCSIISLTITGLPARQDSDYAITITEQVESSCSQIVNVVEQEIGQDQERNNLFGESASEPEDIIQLDDQMENNNHITPVSKNSDVWAQWNPKSLKKRKNKLLDNTQKTTITDTGNSYVELMKLKQDLIKEQINLVKKEIELRDVELKSKIEINELTIKSHQLDIQIKEKQLNNMI